MVRPEIRKFARVPWLAWCVAGCAPLLPGEGVYSPPVAAGARLEVHRQIPIRAGYARVHLQHGEPVSHLEMDQYAPQCSFVMDVPRREEQFVQPGEYRVIRVRQEDTGIVRRAPLLVASTAARSGWDDGGEILLATLVKMDLEGPQPDVRSLQCSGPFASPANVLPPSPEDINGALGDYASLFTAAPVQ